MDITIEVVSDMAAAFERGTVITDHGLEWKVPADRGYGVCFWNTEGFNIQVRAHRVAWMLENGPIPAGFDIDHDPSCPKTCVTASHLQALSKSDHIRLGWERGELNGGWGTKRERIHPPRPTPFAWKVEKPCKNCGVFFLPEQNKQYHCDRECAYQYKEGRRKSQRNPRPSTLNCAWCSEPFEPKRKDSTLCSRKCQDAVQNEKKKLRKT